MSKDPIDWETIEKDWRAGIKTKLQMSEEYGVSRAAIDKHFGKLGIDRDLSEKIRQKAESLVTQQAVTHEVTKGRLVTTEKEIIDSNAAMQAAKLLSHRKVLSRHQEYTERLSEELETCGDDVHKKAATNKLLADTRKTLIGLERQALGIADNAEGDKPVDKPREETSIETARKIAFALALGMQQAKANG